MGNEIILTKSGELHYYYEDENEVRHRLKCSYNNRTILSYLNHYVLLEEGFTLRNFFDILNRYDVLTLLHPAIINYSREYFKLQHMDKQYKDPNMDYLEVGKFTQVQLLKGYFRDRSTEHITGKSFSKLIKNFKPRKHFHISHYNDMKCIGYLTEDDDNFENRKAGDQEIYGIGLTPLSKLLDLEIRLANEQVNVETHRKGFNDFSEGIPSVTYIEEFHHINLFEFIQIIMESISAYGDDPEERDYQSDIIYDRLDKAEEMDKNNDKE